MEQKPMARFINPFSDWGFKKLSEITDISALSHEEREKYDESLKYMRDYNASLEGAKIIGHREGLLESQANIARMMLNDGESIDKIMRYTGLTEDQIKQLNLFLKL